MVERGIRKEEKTESRSLGEKEAKRGREGHTQGEISQSPRVNFEVEYEIEESDDGTEEVEKEGKESGEEGGLRVWGFYPTLNRKIFK